MIPENLLIQVEPIRWIGDFSIVFVADSFSVVLFIFLIFFAFRIFQKKKSDRKKQRELLGTLPLSGEKHFEQHAAILLRRYIQNLYLPHSSQAHTAKDVEKYVDDSDIIAILVMLEQAEYRNSELNQEEQIQVLECLK